MIERLAHASELLDAPTHDPAELAQSLRHIDEVNRWLGGHRALLHALEPLVTSGDAGRIIDIGTGSADAPLAIDEWARRRRIAVSITATDVHEQVRAIAAANVERVRRHDATGHMPHIEIAAADARTLPFPDDAFDVALLSLTLHHFEIDTQIVVLREAARVARRAVIVSELERCWPNYMGALVLAQTRWRGNRLTRHDGPISVLRGFRADELAALARRAALDIRSLQRRFFYRLIMVAAAHR